MTSTTAAFSDTDETATVRTAYPNGLKPARVRQLGQVRLSRYWPHLAQTLMCVIETIHDAHAVDCTRFTGCATCAAIGEALAWVDAHHHLQANGSTDPTVTATIPHPTRGFQP